jgi:hypothetical protein
MENFSSYRAVNMLRLGYDADDHCMVRGEALF